MNKDPVDLDRTLQYVRSAITNQRIVFGLKNTEVKRVTLQEASEQSESIDTESSKPAIIRTVYKKGTTEPDISNFDARLRKIEEDLRDTKVSLIQILDFLRSQNHDNRQRSTQRPVSRDTVQCKMVIATIVVSLDISVQSVDNRDGDHLKGTIQDQDHTLQNLIEVL